MLGPSAALRRSLTVLAGIGTVLVFLLSAAWSLAGPPPAFRPAHGLPGEDIPAVAVGNQDDPAIARGGNQFLVAWTDDRTSFLVAGAAAGSNRDVYAARLDQDGALLDTTPIVISQGPGDQFDPTVVWNGTEWLVIWTGSVPYGPYYVHRVEGARVSSAGEVLDPTPIVLWDGGNSDERLVGAASDGTDWALVFKDVYYDGLATKTRLVGKKLTADGALLSAPTYLFSPSCCYFFYDTGMAYADGVYMVVFEGYVSSFNYGIFGLRMTPNLTLLDSYPVVLTQIPMQGETHYYRTPNVTSNGSQFFVGWQLYIDNDKSQVYSARVDAAGNSLDGDGFPISGDLPLSLHLLPDLAWDGTQWIVGWQDGGLNLARVSAGGTLLDPGGQALGGQPGAAIEGATAGTQVVWPEVRHGGINPLDLFTSRLATDLVLGPEHDVALGAPSQTSPDVATGADGYMLVYRSDVSGQTRIMAHPLDASGEALTPAPVQLASGAVETPRVAFDGTRYLAVWHQSSSDMIQGLRLAGDGTILDGSPVSLLGGFDPDVAGRDGSFLVTAARSGGSPGVAGAVVAGADPLVPLVPQTFGTGNALGPRATRLGSRWFVVWEDAGAADGGEIMAALVEAGGSPLGSFPLTVPSDGLAHHRPAIAAGDSALVVWQDAPSDPEDLNLYVFRLTADLHYLDPPTGTPLVTAPGNQTEAAVAWDGERFTTAFVDDRNSVNLLDTRTDVDWNWISASGPVADPSGATAFAASVPEFAPAVAGEGGSPLIAASVFSPAPPHAAYRIEVRFAAQISGVPGGNGVVPGLVRLLSAYPNPANPSVEIRFSLARESDARVEIYDLQGARINTLRAGRLPAGLHELHWDGRDASGQAAPSGTYLFLLRAGAARQSGKLTLVR